MSGTEPIIIMKTLPALLVLFCLLAACLPASCGGKLPVVINTWPFVDANVQGEFTIQNGGVAGMFYA